MKKATPFLFTLLMLLSPLSGCIGKDSTKDNALDINQASLSVTWGNNSSGIIIFELYPNAAPNHVENFLALIDGGYYDGVIFHRIIQGFVVQGGDFQNNNGTGGHAVIWTGYCNGQPSTNVSDCAQTSWTLPDEADNGLKHEPYVLSMAKTPQPNTGGSQFFIVSPNSTPSHLDGVHTVFGKVIEGFEVIDALDATPVGEWDKPIDDCTMDSGQIIES
jgi:cyclophilin family peptidyl-prolyl cis-trans isomerase